VTTDSTPPIDPIATGVTFDHEGRVFTDLPCWTCDYNLRTLEHDAACPECGTPIATTLEHRDSRKTRPFSLYTLNHVSRVLGIIYGLIGPAFIVFIAASTPMTPLNVDWQSGDLKDYVGTMLAGRAMWAFYPFLIWAYVAYAAVMIQPIKVGRMWWARAGLLFGCILGLQYQLIICLNFFGLSGELFWSLFIGAIPLGILAGIVGTHAARDASRDPRPRDKRTGKSIAIQISATLGLLLVFGFFSRGVILLPILVAGPYLMLLCMSATLCRLYRTDFDQPPAPSKPLPVTVTAGGYIAAWPIAISQAQVVYNALPTQPPGCYVCTASAYGHRWLTRAEPVQFADGRWLLVTKQMRTLKAAENRIAQQVPQLHRVMRRVYDRLGPAIASRIRSPWLADVSYFFFVPFAVVAWLLLRIAGRSAEIDQTYR
jgi:hypothetical protein